MVGRFKSTSQIRENQISRYLTVQSRIEILIWFQFLRVLHLRDMSMVQVDLTSQLDKLQLVKWFEEG